MHREADMIEQQAKQGKQDPNQQGGKTLQFSMKIWKGNLSNM
jgi:hypothetical protein